MADLEFEDEESLDFYFKCKDLEGNPSEAETSNTIQIKKIIDIVVSNIDNEIEGHDWDIDAKKSEKDILKADLEREDDESEKSKIEKKIKGIDNEINYLIELKENAENLKSSLIPIQTKIESIKTDELEVYASNIERLVDSLEETEYNLDYAIEVGSITVHTLLIEKMEMLNDLYYYYDRNITKTEESRDLKNDYIIERKRKEKKDMESSKKKYAELEKIDGISYARYINDLKFQIDNIEEDIAELVYLETLEDMEYRKELFEAKLGIKEEYLLDIGDLIIQIEERIGFAQRSEHLTLENELKKILQRAEAFKSDIESEIDGLKIDIAETAGDITSFKLNRDAFTSGKQPIFEIELIINIGRIDDLNQEIIADTSGNGILVSQVSAKLLGNTSELTTIGINKLRESAYNDTDDITTIEMYYINSTSDIQIEEMEFTFVLEPGQLSLLNITADDISLYLVDELTWKKTKIITQSIVEDQNVTIHSVIYGAGYYALAYQIANGSNDHNSTGNETGPGIDDGDLCEPEWECGEWGICIEGASIRECRDNNNCSIDNNTRIDEQECEIDPKPTCSDGIKNGDEEGIDCGGSCPELCPGVDIPSYLPVEEKKSPAILIILVLLVILAAISAMYKINPDLVRSVLHIEKGQSKKSKLRMILLDKIVKKMFYYEDLDQIKNDDSIKGESQESISYIIQVVQYVLSNIDKKVGYKNVVQLMVEQGWDAEDAASTVGYITTRYVYYQMKEYGFTSTESPDERAMIKEMFASEGHDEEIIIHAMNMLEDENAGSKRKDKSTS
jgi:hypothetical protein